MFEPDPLTFFKKNKIPGTFSDHVFLTYCTITLGHYWRAGGESHLRAAGEHYQGAGVVPHHRAGGEHHLRAGDTGGEHQGHIDPAYAPVCLPSIGQWFGGCDSDITSAPAPSAPAPSTF